MQKGYSGTKYSKRLERTKLNSNRKGKDGEREVATILKRRGFPARRGVQYHGSPDSPDVIGIDGVHIEVKRVEALNIDQALEQSARDAGSDIPTVFHRRNGKKWKVTMYLSDWLEIIIVWLRAKKEGLL